MGVFNYKNFNSEVFGKYLETVPRVKQNAFLSAGILRSRPELKTMLVDQTGGNYISVPMSGRIGGTALNYDGSTDITATALETFLQSMIVVGRAKAWEEKDFSKDITGKDFMEVIAAQVATYWDDVDQQTILAIIKGMYKCTDNSFNTDHTYDITGETTATVGATTLNNAIQKAAGANKSLFTMAIMHSQIATNLENLQLLEYRKYTDEKGIQRDMSLADWNGRTVLIDDDGTIENGYWASTSSTTGALKVVASGASTGEINLATVKAADFYPSAVAANDYVLAGVRYVTHLLGQGAFDYCDCGAAVPNEPWRDPKTAGGKEWLITRQRKLFAPKGFSFKQPSTPIVSPTDAELSAANWKIVKDTAGTGYYDSKAIPFARIISKG